ncbi:tuzin, putative [Leishmania panamensis]|uniref:tuzin, putative n=1 Tax=Leishmania panamensis TaxID=5679 RepID=UPI0004F8DE11|nr:tuzin, putative [Leishmania panamensis]AIN95877.1 tuzin, putative [Leishmania panamensis]
MRQRSSEMRFAVRTLCKKAPPGASTTADAAHQLSRQTRREALERWIRPVFQQLDTAHPRIAVITGPFGCGKSSLCRAAMREDGMVGVVVDVRVREDPLRRVIKALGVPHVEACGDALDFISEACCRAKSMMGGKTPVSVLGLREADSLARVYNEALALACERRVCHVVVEVPLEALTVTSTRCCRAWTSARRRFWIPWPRAAPTWMSCLVLLISSVGR